MWRMAAVIQWRPRVVPEGAIAFQASVRTVGGIVVLPDGCIKGAAERVRACGGLLIAAEVQSGFCKTGEAMWGFEAHRVVPDT
jgi:alanine-glyoxylate transaminase/(R)-3-amino-2-methylpropionate-pyruvate transaminase